MGALEFRFDELLRSQAFSDEAWATLGEGDLEAHQQDRAILRAHADALASPMHVLSAWRGDRLLAIVVGVGIEDARMRSRIFIVTAPGVLRGQCRGVWIAPGPDGADTIRAVLEALPVQLRPHGYARLIVQTCIADDSRFPTTARELGYRAFVGPADYRIDVAAGADFESHLASLGGRKRWNLRKDLRRASDSGATVALAAPLSDALWDELWPLQLDTLNRKGTRLLWREGGLFRALRHRLPPAASGAVVCRKDERLLGFALFHRAGALVRWPYVGHVADPPLHVYAAVAADMLRGEIDRAARARCSWAPRAVSTSDAWARSRSRRSPCTGCCNDRVALRLRARRRVRSPHRHGLVGAVRRRSGRT